MVNGPMKKSKSKRIDCGVGGRCVALFLAVFMLFGAASCGPNSVAPPDGSVKSGVSQSKTNETNNATTGGNANTGNETPRGDKNIGNGDIPENILLALPDTKLDSVNYDDISPAFREALWGFAGKTSGHALGDDDDKNALYSPISLYYPLAMLEAGARGKTLDGLRALLSLSDENNDGGINSGAQLRKLYALMTYEEKKNIERIANSIWMSNEYRDALSETWLDQLSHDFYAAAFAVDFKDQKTSDAMNAWVREATRDKIDPQFKPAYFNDTIICALMNTLYYKAAWRGEYFNEATNQQEIFHAPKGDVSATFMRGAFIDTTHLEDDRWHAVKLDLSNGCIRLVLPNEGINPETLLEDEAFLPALREDQWKTCALNISVPKFKYEASIDLLDKLEPIGVKALLGREANPDFSDMLKESARDVVHPYVSKIDQKSFIAFEENGIEAAAMTIIEVSDESCPNPEDVVEIAFDRPFLYVIEDNAGTPLFVGIVRNPEAM